jgi:uncharacterized membrane protein YgdD (TMEM256/DUF423 family)
MNKSIVMTASVLGFLAVVLGAMGAHALKEVLSEASLDSFNTAVRYQAWHAIAMLALGFNQADFPFKKRVYQFWLFGVILFSGSIYLLSLSSLIEVKLSFLGPVTPIGGLFMIAGWAALFLGAQRFKNT